MRNKIMLTPQFLADLKEKAKQASPGPWFENGEVTICPPHGHRQEFDEVAHEGDGIYERSIAYCHLKADAAYIAAANPAIVLALIEKIERLEEDFDTAARSAADESVKAVVLEEEANWLADRLNQSQCYFLGGPSSPQAWREAARNAVEKENEVNSCTN